MAERTRGDELLAELAEALRGLLHRAGATERLAGRLAARGGRPLVVVESPYKSGEEGGRDRNVAYARRAVRDALGRGEAPAASHLLYTQPGVLDDDVPEEREAGIAAGHAFLARADLAAFYVDLGISRGMESGFRRAMRDGVPVEFRSFEGVGAGVVGQIAVALGAAGMAFRPLDSHGGHPGTERLYFRWSVAPAEGGEEAP